VAETDTAAILRVAANILTNEELCLIRPENRVDRAIGLAADLIEGEGADTAASLACWRLMVCINQTWDLAVYGAAVRTCPECVICPDHRGGIAWEGFAEGEPCPCTACDLHEPEMPYPGTSAPGEYFEHCYDYEPENIVGYWQQRHTLGALLGHMRQAAADPRSWPRIDRVPSPSLHRDRAGQAWHPVALDLDTRLRALPALKLDRPEATPTYALTPVCLDALAAVLDVHGYHGAGETTTIELKDGTARVKHWRAGKCAKSRPQDAQRTAVLRPQADTGLYVLDGAGLDLREHAGDR
jgi:hypothetical protein